jgi:broad specificity phosphatase PhoE
LSPTGVEQVVAACRLMQQEESLLPTLVKYSLAASCIDTATILGQELKLGTDRLVPEFTFLDPRAIGDWDMSDRNLTLPAVWAMDSDEAGRDGLQGRPPASDDSTPNEVLSDQAVRLRQVLSILESQYSGDTILLIFPDGTGPALLSAMIAGIPYNRAHEIDFKPGEIRFDVTMESTLALWKSKQILEGASYSEILKEGRAALKELRATQMRGGTVINLKDKKIEEERVAIETEYRRKERRRLDAERKEHEQRRKRQQEIAVQRGNSTGSDVVSLITMALASIVAVGSPFWFFDKSSELVAKESDPGMSSGIVDMAGMDKERTPSTANISFPNVTLNMTLSTTQVLDPIERARIAMEEYMNRDDGADDWILSLSQIMEEDEDERITVSDANGSSTPIARRKNESMGYIGELQNLTTNGEMLTRAIGDELSLKVDDFVLSSDNEEAFQ